MADIFWSGLGWFASTFIGSVIGVGTSMYVKRIDRRAELAKRRYEFAEEVLASFYEAENAIKDIRDVGGGREGSSPRPRDQGETPEESERLDRAYLIKG